MEKIYERHQCLSKEEKEKMQKYGHEIYKKLAEEGLV